MSFGRSTPPAPPIPPPPTRLGDEPEINAAVSKQRRKTASATSRQSTILGGSTMGAQPYVKSLLGQ